MTFQRFLAKTIPMPIMQPVIKRNYFPNQTLMKQTVAQIMYHSKKNMKILKKQTRIPTNAKIKTEPNQITKKATVMKQQRSEEAVNDQEMKINGEEIKLRGLEIVEKSIKIGKIMLCLLEK